MIDRPEYIEKITPFMGKPIVKVVTGMRRVGKGRLLELLRQQLLLDGVPDRAVFSSTRSCWNGMQ